MGKFVRLVAAVLLVVMAAPFDAMAQDDEAYGELVKATRYASAGSLSRSVKHFERVLKIAPDSYPLAYFNLAEVYRAKKECGKAVILYDAYARKVATPEARAESDKAIRLCPGARAVVTLEIFPVMDSKVILDGYVLAAGAASITMKLVPGKYVLEVLAKDHISSKQELEVTADGLNQSVKLKLQTFHGHVMIACDTPGAKVRVFAGPSDKTDVLHQGGVLTEALKLTEGKHFVEVTAPGFDRWIRNVRIARDETTDLTVVMTKERPPELN